MKIAEQDEGVIHIREEFQKFKLKKWNNKVGYAKRHYYKRKRNGDYSIVIDEWDEFELLQLREKNKKIEGEILMSERRVLVRLSKAFNNVEVEVSGIESSEQFLSEKEWAKAEAFSLINALPDEQLGSKPAKKYTPKQYTKEYTEPVAPQIQHPTANATRQDITTKFLKGGQFNIALTKINKGELTLQQVNAISSWDEMQHLLFNK